MAREGNRRIETEKRQHENTETNKKAIKLRPLILVPHQTISGLSSPSHLDKAGKVTLRTFILSFLENPIRLNRLASFVTVFYYDCREMG